MDTVPKVSSSMEEQTNNNNSHEEANGDEDRQILAPAEGPRESLINTAIKFLQNPKVAGSPLAQKKAFLTKKGLTQEEIDIAVGRSGVQEQTVSLSGVDTGLTGPPPPGYHPGMAGQLVPAAYGPPIPPQSRWAQLRDFTLTSVVVVGMSYGVYQLYKAYIEPLIMGKSAQDKRLDRLESDVAAIHKSISESLSEVSKTLAAIQLSINNQGVGHVSANNSVDRGLTDLKADISSLRSLLLSKNQFPAPPSTSPVLPSWQLAGASSGGALQNGNPEAQPSASTVSTCSFSSLSSSSAVIVGSGDATSVAPSASVVGEKEALPESHPSPSQLDGAKEQVIDDQGSNSNEDNQSS